MKKQFRMNVMCGNNFAVVPWFKYLYGMVPMACIIFLILFSGCAKQQSEKQVNVPVDKTDMANLATDDEFLAAYNTNNSSNVEAKKSSGFTWTTFIELLEARLATAKYLSFDRALSDGYADINTYMPHMGWHYLKAANLDDKFDVTKPELLVYKKNINGTMQLEAAEYAVPFDAFPNGVPTKEFGFTGTNDKWDYNAMFNVWTLHAWIWYFNPSGVFAPFNPLVP